MNANNMYNIEKQSGFALLISLIVVGVVISIGLSILDLSIKQVRLSSNATESELAFHAANAGMECARYWRRKDADLIEGGLPISPTCFDRLPDENIKTQVPTLNVVGDGVVFQYEYDFTWGTGTEVRCTSVNMVAASPILLGQGVTTTDMTTLIRGYPNQDGNSTHCAAGSQCTTISVQGYNVQCDNKDGYGVAQREVLVEF